MVPGDLVFLKDSREIDSKTPLIIIERFRAPVGTDIFVLLHPQTGARYHYQEHNLTEDPL